MTYFTSLNISKLELTCIFLPCAFQKMYCVKSLSDFDGPAFFENSNDSYVHVLCKNKLSKGAKPLTRRKQIKESMK